jgi:hypothetical protein
MISSHLPGMMSAASNPLGHLQDLCVIIVNPLKPYGNNMYHQL